jgi:hypothetical protein
MAANPPILLQGSATGGVAAGSTVMEEDGGANGDGGGGGGGCRDALLGRANVQARERAATTSQHSSSNFLAEKKGSLSKFNAITCLTITSKWSASLIEIFLLLNKYPTLCGLKTAGAS